MPALAKPQPPFWALLWDHVRELLPMLPGAESTGGQGNPDLGLGMDPDG